MNITREIWISAIWKHEPKAGVSKAINPYFECHYEGNALEAMSINYSNTDMYSYLLT